ncbi:hypothetical protein OH687_19575 [Burkholderia anthina]|nr:hypothetical protein OH687_19575 [Burkholderia anthina]
MVVPASIQHRCVEIIVCRAASRLNSRIRNCYFQPRIRRMSRVIRESIRNGISLFHSTT